MVNDLKWEVVKNRPAAEAGQVRPEVRKDEDRRGATNDALRQQAGRGDVPQPHQKSSDTPTLLPKGQQPAQVRSGQMQAPSTTTQPHTDVSQAQPPKGDLPSVQSPEAREALLQQGRKAADGLAQLESGGKAAKRAATSQAKAPLTPEAAMRSALIASLAPGPKATAQAKLPATPAKTTTPDARAQEPAAQEKEAVLAKAEGQSGAKQGKDAETVATQVAQRAPSPFTTQSQGETVAAERKREELKKIATDGATTRALDHVVTGRGVTAIATAQEFTSGGYGGFGDPQTESAGLAGKVGAAPQIHVYGDTQDYPETEMLYAKLGLSTVLYGAQELAQRAVPIGERIANTQDDTPLSQRMMGDRVNQDQAALGTRFSPYGKGTFA